jgi:signal peptidase I
MIPNLVVGDFILVKKYEFGIRLPLSNIKIINNNLPEHGDVIVFQYPQDRKINYIKRVVALPGDYVEYIDKQIFINGQKYKLSEISNNVISSIDLSDNELFIENNGSSKYMVMKNNSRDQNFSYKVPEKTYFVLGDNRDNSNDSRYWGPVPESHLIGKAFLIWMHLNPSGSYSLFDRIGKSID